MITMEHKIESCPATSTKGKDGTFSHSTDKYLFQLISNPDDKFYVCENHYHAYSSSPNSYKQIATDIVAPLKLSVTKMWETCQYGMFVKNDHAGNIVWLTCEGLHNGVQSIFATCENHLKKYLDADCGYKVYEGSMEESKPKVKMAYKECPGGACFGKVSYIVDNKDSNFVTPVCETHINAYLATTWYKLYPNPESVEFYWEEPKPNLWGAPFTWNNDPLVAAKGLNLKTPKEIVVSKTCIHGQESGKLNNKKVTHSPQQWEVTYPEFNGTTHKYIVCKKHLYHYGETHGYKIGKQIMGKDELTSSVPVEGKLWHMLYRDRGSIMHYVLMAADQESAKKNLHSYLMANYGKTWADETVKITKINEVVNKVYSASPVLTITESER